MTADEWDGSLTSYPIPIPTAGQGASGSYWVTHCLNCTVAPDTYIKDIRYYQTWSSNPDTDWSLSNGDTGDPAPGLYIGISSASVADARIYTQGFPSGSYDQATGTQGIYGDIISGSNGHTYYKELTDTALSGGMVPIEHFDNLSNAYMVQSGQALGASTGRSYCIVTQVVVGSGATAGEKTDKTATWVYSEA
jgi:hypothetical protein